MQKHPRRSSFKLGVENISESKISSNISSSSSNTISNNHNNESNGSGNHSNSHNNINVNSSLTDDSKINKSSIRNVSSQPQSQPQPQPFSFPPFRPPGTMGGVPAPPTEPPSFGAATDADYRAALESAYYSGAAAAAAALSSGRPAVPELLQMHTTASCPNFGQAYGAGTGGSASASAGGNAPSLTSLPAPPDVASSSIPFPDVENSGDIGSTPSLSSSSFLGMVSSSSSGGGAGGVGGVGGMGGVGSAAAIVASSQSMPDMPSAVARAATEEEKRKKRLARNRQSARMRRLKKKNLVDTYEVEVGVLEASLAKLQAHSWGNGHNHMDLVEALSMDQGQQTIRSPEERLTLIHNILEQQREQLQSVADVHYEHMLLGWLANYGDQPQDARPENAPTPTAMDEEKELAAELNEILQLTPVQKEALKKEAEGMYEERKAIETVDSCLESLLKNDWLMNHPVEEFTKDFLSILNPNQTSKFLSWADHNAESIDQLDYIRAPTENAPPQNSPIFMFGVDNESTTAATMSSSSIGEGSANSKPNQNLPKTKKRGSHSFTGSGFDDIPKKRSSDPFMGHDDDTRQIAKKHGSDPFTAADDDSD